MGRAGLPAKPVTAGTVQTSAGRRRNPSGINWFGRGGGAYDPPLYAEQIEAFNRLVDRTNRRYSKCMANGGHVDSGDTIERHTVGSTRTFRICRRCEVPYIAK